jgi:CcmD family protein
MSYLTAAFIGVWVLVTLYLVYIGQRQRSLEQELHALEEQLSDQKRKKK